MTRRFFALTEDVYVSGRWYLSDPVEQGGGGVNDIWRFTEGERVAVGEHLMVPIQRPGKELDFTAAGAASTPIVSARIASSFKELSPDDVQIFPVGIDGACESYFLLVVTKLIECIDDNACRKVERWSPEDGRPEKIGQYRSIYGLRIDPVKAESVRVFRLWGWPLPIIVDEEVKTALEQIGMVGGKFAEV